MLSVFAFSGSMMAQSISIENVEVKQGGTGTIVVELIANGKSDIRDYQFDLILPEGITYVNSKMTSGTDHGIGVQEISDWTGGGTRYRFLPASISGAHLSEGSVMEIEITADESLEVGSDNFATVTGSNQSDGTKVIKISADNGVYYTQDDFSFNIKIIDNIVILDETSTVAPERVENTKVLVKRTIKAGEWSTICLPFAMTEAQVKAAFGNGVQLAEFSGSDVYFDGSSVANIRINFITEGVSTIEANHPYVIKSERNIPNEDEEEFKEGFRVDEVSIVDGTPTIKKSATWHIQGMDISGGPDEFIGSYVVTEIPVNSLFLSGSTYYYATAATKKMKGFRAYFTLTKELDDKSASSAKIGFFIDDETTAIDGINAGQRVIDGVYDLQGRKVMVKDGDINNLQRGLYIINGKKVAIK